MRKTLATLLITAAAPILLATNSNADTCTPTIDIAVDGTGSVNSPLSIAAQHAPNAIRIQYPGSIWPLGPYTYDQSVAIGVTETKRVVQEQHARCPGSAIRIVGHSQGARVAGDAISELAAEGDTSYIQGELLSDPRHRGTGIEIMVPFGLPGNRFMSERNGFGNANVNQVCVAGDTICDFPNLMENPAKALDVIPGYLNLHGAYPIGVQNQVAAPAAPAPAVTLPALPPLPPLPNLAEPYTPRPVSTYVPAEVQPFIPREVLDFVPPPLPPLPALPALPF